MKKISITSIFLFFAVFCMAHPWKPSHYVIVDTDGGIDDMKALCMLLASPDVRLLAVTVSDGILSEDAVYKNVREMLDAFHHEGIPVVRGGGACALIAQSLRDETTPVTFIALGSLRTAAAALNTIPEFRTKIKQIVWSNDGLPGTQGYNYRIAPEAAEKIINDTISLLVTGTGGEEFYDENTAKEIAAVNTRYAQQVTEILRKNSQHAFAFTAYDEMVPLALHFPALFSISASGNKSLCIPKDIKSLQRAAITILSGATVKKMQVMKVVPADTAFYMPDLQPIVTEAINKYGEDEWTSGVIANELHRHLGVFAIIGVKMGIRAREYFCTGVDEFRVTSFAGSMPPLSCMNDGLQVSTGATPGHGLLTVATESPLTPSAKFTYRGVTIRLSLKKELSEKVLSELKEINFIYGLDSNIYWELVRKNSVKYWLQLNRNEIFDIEVISNTGLY